MLLFRREEIAERLGVIGAVVGEAALIGAVAVVAALVVPRLRDVLPAGVTLTLAGLVAAAGLTEVHRAEAQFGDAQTALAAELDGVQHDWVPLAERRDYRGTRASRQKR